LLYKRNQRLKSLSYCTEGQPMIELEWEIVVCWTLSIDKKSFLSLRQTKGRRFYELKLKSFWNEKYMSPWEPALNQ
jgi:hypothetical protein